MAGAASALPLKLAGWCLLSIVMLWGYTQYRFHIDKVDERTLSDDDAGLVRRQIVLLRRCRSIVKYALPAAMGTILILGAGWKAAPTFFAHKAEAVVRQSDGRETLRYRTGPASEVFRAPPSKMTVVIVAAPERELRRSHIVSGVDLNDVVSQSLRGVDIALSELALVLILGSLFLMGGTIFGDALGVRQYARAQPDT
jgi:hypothetical protein